MASCGRWAAPDLNGGTVPGRGCHYASSATSPSSERDNREEADARIVALARECRPHARRGGRWRISERETVQRDDRRASSLIVIWPRQRRFESQSVPGVRHESQRRHKSFTK